MSRALVIGYGSIGQRHVRVLGDLGHDVAVVSRRAVDHAPRFETLAEALEAFAPDYVVIANETSAHRSALTALTDAGYAGLVLVEKPLFERGDAADRDETPDCFVAYNLRFHPLLESLRAWLRGRTAVAAWIHVGQHLSTWRPGRDFRKTYSASPELGGGVLRDLSHELDYALWMFGPWRRVTALGGASGTLGIEADDQWSILAECAHCPQVGITLSYLDHTPRRQIVVTAQDDTASVDFIAGTFSSGDEPEPEPVKLDRDETYRRQHTALLAGAPAAACTYAEGYAVLRLIDAVEQAAAHGRWVEAG
jgi:predicted dehydrogenase